MPINAITSAPPAGLDVFRASAPVDRSAEAKLKETFQDFAAGTVFKQMLKSLRSMHDKPAYFHGGAAEETFRTLMDERVAEDLARSHGASIAEPLFHSFANRVPVDPKPASGSVASPVQNGT